MSPYIETSSERHRILVATVTLILAMLILPAYSQEPSLAELKQKAEQGDSKAQFNLGVIHAHGKDVPQDYQEAARWFRLAVEQGHAEAQFDLGVIHEHGRGVLQDYQEAARWYRAAADQGLSSGQYNLGVMYDDGRGVTQDYIQAHKWYNLAASKSAGKVREAAAKNRDSVANQMTREQIAEAQRLAREWKPKR